MGDITKMIREVGNEDANLTEQFFNSKIQATKAE